MTAKSSPGLLLKQTMLYIFSRHLSAVNGAFVPDGCIAGFECRRLQRHGIEVDTLAAGQGRSAPPQRR
jgi:hypothetical protein